MDLLKNDYRCVCTFTNKKKTFYFLSHRCFSCLTRAQIRTVFLMWLPWILRMSRPGRKISRKSILMSNRMKELELKERSSKSLLANVLDLDDNFVNQQGLNSSQTAIGSRYVHFPSASFSYSFLIRTCARTFMKWLKFDLIANYAYAELIRIFFFSLFSIWRSFGRPTTVEEHHSTNCNHRDLHLILKELQFITARMKRSDDEAELVSDWKFAAMVVDRYDNYSIYSITAYLL